MSTGLYDQSDVFKPEDTASGEELIAQPETNAGATGHRLDGRELRRRFWHMAPGLAPIILWFIPHRDPISPTLMIIVATVAAIIAAKIYFQFLKIQRVGEHNDGSAVLGYSMSVLGAFLLFPAHAEIGLTVLAILAFGDGSATLIGLAVGGKSLPWNPKKSWSGAVGFVLIGLPVAAVVYWQETHNLEAIGPGVTLAQACLCVSPAVVLAMLAESIDIKLNDNIRVGVVAVLMLAIMHAAMFGL